MIDVVSVGERPRSVWCPHCWRRTEKVQLFETTTIFSLVVYFAWVEGKVAGCPRCVRRQLWEHLAYSIPLSNVLFPFTALRTLAQIYQSHARKKRGIPEECLAWADLKPPLVKSPPAQGVSAARGLIGLAVVAIVVAVVFFVLPWLTQPRQ